MFKKRVIFKNKHIHKVSPNYFSNSVLATSKNKMVDKFFKDMSTVDQSVMPQVRDDMTLHLSKAEPVHLKRGSLQILESINQ